MKYLVKIALLLCGVFCFILACEQKEPAKADLTSYDEIFRDGDTMPAVGPAALRIVPGNSWRRWINGDSILTNGFALMSQDSVNSKERIVTDVAMLDWLLGILPDSLEISGGSGLPDTLTITAIGDTLSIQGSNSVQVPYRLFGVDEMSDIYANSFPLGSRIINRANGAQYLVQADSVSGYTTDSMAVIPTGSRYAVLQPQQGQYDVTHFGAVGDNATDNGDMMTRIGAFVGGNHWIFIPRGRFLFDGTIEVGVNGLKIKGEGGSKTTIADGAYGSILHYTGTGSAIEAAAGIGSGSTRANRIILQDFALAGTDSAEHGIKLDLINVSGGSLQSDKISNLRIADFGNSGSYAIYLTRVYGATIDECRITNCYNGIYLGNESVNIAMNNNWITGHSLYGIHCVYAGQNNFNNGIIDHVGTPDATQRGIYNSGELNISGCLFEGNYVHVEATSTAKMVISDSKFNSSDSTTAALANGASIRLIGNRLPGNSTILTGLGTEWIGGIEGEYTPPSITSDNPSGFATRTNMDGAGGAFTLTTFSTNGVPNSLFTLYFLDDSVTINNSGGTQKIRLKDGLPFKGYAGDRLIMQKRENIAGATIIEEVGRVRHSDNYMQNRSSDYTVVSGDHGLNFTNKGATDTVTFTLPNPTSFDENMKFTFTKLDSEPMRIVTTGTPRKIRGGTTVSYLYLEDLGTSLTLQLDSLIYEIIASNGLYRYSNPESGYSGGNFSGVGMAKLKDSIGLATITQDYIPYGQGTTTLGTYSGFRYNSTAGTNTRRITISNGTTGPYTTYGVGNSDGANRPGLATYSNTSPATLPAANIIALRSEGNSGSPSNLTDMAALFMTFQARAYRNGAYRNAAAIVIEGGSSGSTTSYSGVIGFNTAANTVYARRATIQRNGDFYIGDGLATNDLESPSAKLYLRASNTTASEYALLVQNSTPTSLMSVRNGGEVNIGDMTDLGNYILQVTGDVYISGTITAKTPYTSKTASYTATAFDEFIEATANSFTINLPTAVGITGKAYTVKNTGAGTITIDPDGTETIDGASTKSITVQYEAITVMSNGTNWLIK